ncbi:MAG: sugar ABC transporter ATP-binding protein [Clostridia bacterium]
MAKILLELHNISKTFPGVKALEDVHFALEEGEIHALMGENGAGKSTFIKVITGVHAPDPGGHMLLDGKEVHFQNPREAAAAGIAAIYQHLAAYPDLSVAENIFMGHERTTGPFKRINWRITNRMARELLVSLGSEISPTERMGVLSVAQQQLVEIAKALSQNARVLIMDEPTAALSKRESEDLYGIVRKLRDQGTSVILISHRFEDMYKLADRVTVLRDAKYIGTWPVDGVSNDLLVKHMVGRSIDQFFPHKEAVPGKELLRAENLSRTGYFRGVNFTLHAGEIVGLTGLVGAGRTEVVEALCGVTKLTGGSIYLEGTPVVLDSPNKSMKLGVGLLPEDRQKQALLLPWSIGKNITLPTLDKFKKHGLLSAKAEREEADTLAKKLSVKATTTEESAESLSGGNQQKVVVAKLLSGNTKVLIMDEPTKGVDVGSKAAIYQIMCDLTAQGYGILMVSSEMPEVTNMCDRILVMREGHLSAEFTHADVSPEAILTAAMPLDK